MFAAQTIERLTLKRPLTCAALLAALVTVIAGCAPASPPASSTAATADTPTPAPTATSAPRTLYQADWSQRASEWTLPPHWSIVDGALVNDGDSAQVIPIQIPYVVTSPAYTLHLQIRVIAAKGPGVQNMYGILGQTPSGKLLYTAAASSVQHTLHSYAIVYPAQPDATLPSDAFGTYDFTPGIQSRPYIVQVQGPYISFTAGDGFIGQVKSAAPLTPARLVLVDQNVQLVVERLTITTP